VSTGWITERVFSSMTGASRRFRREESFVPKNGQPLPCIRVLLGAKPVPNAKRAPAGPYTAVLWEASPPKLAVVGKRSARVCAVKVAGRDYSVEVTVFADETDDAERLALLVAGGLTPVAGERPAQVRNGLRAEYFKDREFRERFKSDTWSVVDVNWPGPPAGFPPENYAVRLTGTIVSRQQGLHTFSGMRDDGLRLKIGDDTIVDEWSDGQVAFESRPIFLIKDKAYPIRIEWYNGRGPGMLQLEWKGPIGDVELVPAECFRPGP
jgi:alpha-L-fucosidase